MSSYPYDTELPDEDLLDEEEAEEAGEHEHWRIVADKGQNVTRVDKFLMDHMPDTSRWLLWAGMGVIISSGMSIICSTVSTRMPSWEF